MLEFDSETLYPLLPLDSHTYAEAQAHSECVDHYLGLNTAQIERQILLKLKGKGNSEYPQQLWIGYPTQGILTPYSEIRQILAQISPHPGATIVDLGAAYGRMGFVIGEHYPEVNFVGYEFVEERVTEGSKIMLARNLNNSKLLQADLTEPNFKPIEADFYFIFDYGTRKAIEKTLQDLRETARSKKTTVVARGRACRDAIDQTHPWLSTMVKPEHFMRYSIYRSQN